MGIFGWSYPPGAANDPNAPWNQTDEMCAVCGKWSDDCICPECPECGWVGAPHCYTDPELNPSESNHGLILSDAQRASAAEQRAIDADINSNYSALAAEYEYWRTHKLDIEEEL